RYLTARRRQAFISLISAVSILGVAVGVMALIIALALMTGVQTELRDRIVGATAHVYINGAFTDWQAERHRAMVPGVVGAAPAIVGYGLLTSNQDEFVIIKGIDPELEKDVTEIKGAVIGGSLADLVNRPDDAKDGVVLGADLAESLGVGVGDQVWATTAELNQTPFGMVPRQRPLQVVGLVKFGFYEVDTRYALVSLDTAASLFHRTGVDMIQLRLVDLNDAPTVREQLKTVFGPSYQVRDWTLDNGPLYSALWLEKVAISLTIGLIVMVAALNIVASLVLLVMEKSRDIAILRTMGAPARVVRRIFVFQGLTIGLIGAAAGTIGGLLVCFLANHYQLIKLPADVYQISYLPFRVDPTDVAVVVVSGMVVCLVATVYPSRQAGRIDPAEALRNQ
ncbi:MAG: ABC transporter permease, partial [Acidobacteriota bacterium]